MMRSNVWCDTCIPVQSNTKATISRLHKPQSSLSAAYFNLPTTGEHHETSDNMNHKTPHSWCDLGHSITWSNGAKGVPSMMTCYDSWFGAVCSYLSSAQIVSLYNVCDLLLLAHQCDAPQLVQMCLHNIRVQFNLLKGTEQYEALPEDIKSEVLSEPAKCAADE